MEVLGSGSVVQRDKSKPKGRCRKWELSVRVRLDSGEKTTKTRPFHGTYSNAVKAKGDFITELAGAIEETASGHTFESYANLWHSRRVDAGQCHNSRINEQIRIDRICRYIGDLALESIGVNEIEGVYESMRSDGYAPSTIQLAHSTLSGVIKDAYRRGVIAHNPIDRVNPPKRVCRERRALTDAQMDELAGKMDISDGKEMGVMLCLCCGLRRAEAVALRWSDFDGSAIHVTRSDDGEGNPKPPKTAASVRAVPVPRSLALRMESMRGEPDAWICPNSDGRYMTARSFGQWWTDYRHRYGVDVSLHELRHSYLTRLARAGVHPRVMQSLAGHSSMRVTMEIYTHISMDMERDAVDAAFGT